MIKKPRFSKIKKGKKEENRKLFKFINGKRNREKGLWTREGDMIIFQALLAKRSLSSPVGRLGDKTASALYFSFL